MKENFIDRLKKLMEESKITQTELSKKTGIPQSSLSDWLREKYLPKQDKVDLLARALGVTPAYLMGWKDDSKLEIIGKVDISSNYPYIPFSVAAGSPIEIECITNMASITIPDYLLGKYANNSNVIIMKVSGESMNKIIPNDALIGVLTNVDCENLKNGDLVVFENNYEYSVKRYFDAGDKLIFRPDSTDPSFADIVVNKDENTKIIGKVIMYSIIMD